MNNRRGYAYYILNIFLFLEVFFGIYGNNRNPGDEKLAKEKKKMLCALKRSCLPYCGLEKKKRDYTLTTGLYNTFER